MMSSGSQINIGEIIQLFAEKRYVDQNFINKNELERYLKNIDRKLKFPKVIMITKNFHISKTSSNLVNVEYDMNLLDYFDDVGNPITYDIYVQKIDLNIYTTKFLIENLNITDYYIVKNIEINKLDVFEKDYVTFNFKVYSDSQKIIVKYNSLDLVMGIFGAYFSVFSLFFQTLASLYNNFFYKETIINSIFKYTKQLSEKNEKSQYENRSSILQLNRDINAGNNEKKEMKKHIPIEKSNSFCVQNKNDFNCLTDAEEGYKTFQLNNTKKPKIQKKSIMSKSSTFEKKNASNFNNELEEISNINDQNNSINNHSKNELNKQNQIKDTFSEKEAQDKKYNKISTAYLNKNAPNNIVRLSNIRNNFVKLKSISFIDIFFSDLLCEMCKTSKKQIIIEKCWEVVESKIDIKSLVQNQFEVMFLKKLLLSKLENESFNHFFESINYSNIDDSIKYLNELSHEDNYVKNIDKMIVELETEERSYEKDIEVKKQMLISKLERRFNLI